MNYFDNIDIFSEISEMDQVSLSDFCQIQFLQTGEVLFQEWDDPQALYIISSWTLSIRQDRAWESKEIATLEQWDLVWEMAFFWEPPVRSATVVAKEDSSLIVILHFSVQQILKKYPKLHQTLQGIIEYRIRKNKTSQRT